VNGLDSHIMGHFGHVTSYTPCRASTFCDLELWTRDLQNLTI